MQAVSFDGESFDNSSFSDISGSGLGGVTRQRGSLGVLIAEHEFQGVKKEDLTFKVGDEIEVLRAREKDWWLGRSNGRTGLFPINYVF